MIIDYFFKTYFENALRQMKTTKATSGDINKDYDSYEDYDENI